MKGCVCFVGSASCRAFGHTRPASVPGLSVGLPPLVQARMLAVSHTKPLHDAVAQMADDLYGGFAPKQGCFGCLPKVLHDAKPAEQATLNTHFQKIYRFIDSLKPQQKLWLSVCRKSMFLKQTSNSLSLSPLGHSDGFASCKARRVLISASLPKTPFPGKGGFYWGYRP